MTSRIIDLRDGWQVLQDVHELGETVGVHCFDWDPYAIGAAISPPQPIPRLAHLQLLLSEQPYFGRALRHFNEHPWWYRLEFNTPSGHVGRTTLHFEGVDYFAKVWLNETWLGDHEGYAEPFEFEVGHLLRDEGPNLLAVWVAAPWDTEVPDGLESKRTFAVVRHLVKGTYEHADTFIQRDVNPIGIWRPVTLTTHGSIRPGGRVTVSAEMPGTSRAQAHVSWPVINGGRAVSAEVSLVVRSVEDEKVVASSRRLVRLVAGRSELTETVHIDEPQLWSTWDREGPHLYRADIIIEAENQEALHASRLFGIRTVELIRTDDTTAFLLNGKRIFLRGTNYFPDVYLSNVDRSQYERDLHAMILAGVNAVRVHVHTENETFYDLCDELGMLVVQDFDLNWRYPTGDAFQVRAVRLFASMVERLGGHPCIACWICQNEPMERAAGVLHAVSPGPQLEAAARRLDPDRPVIRSSDVDDPSSGDSHNWSGALDAAVPDYRTIRATAEKLNTEFGFDSPPGPQSLNQIPQIADRLAAVVPRISEIHDYAYCLHKYFVEHYRRQKYAPCSGYFQFMWIDLSPQSFYGLHDWWGRPKEEGIGGGLRALEESNQPIAVLLDYEEGPATVWAVNDSLDVLGRCRAEWVVRDDVGATVASGELDVEIAGDALVRAGAIELPDRRPVRVDILLALHGPAGELLARNIYRDPFNAPPHPEGHPGRMDHEMGMRLYWA
jgi:beta-mannosidase